MKTLIAFELRKNQKNIILSALITGIMIFASMMFFPTISENLNMLGDFLNSGFMQGIMTAFNVDVFAMKTLMGFFAGYSSMWVVLLGSVFFGYLGSEWIAKEERTGTIEFLLSKPLTRGDIFLSKSVSLILSCLVFMCIVGLVGLLAIGVQYKAAPYDLYMEAYSSTLEAVIIDNEESLKAYTQFTEDDLQAFVTGMLMKQYAANKEEINATGIDAEKIIKTLEDELSDPEALFEKMLADPEGYLSLLGIKDITPEDFKVAIEKETQAYKKLKETFLSRDRVLSALFAMDPAYFLNHWINTKEIDGVNNALNSALSDAGIISKLDLNRYGMLIFKMFIVVLVNGFIGLCFAAISKDSASSSQRVMIIILVLYFVNSLSEMSDATRWLHYLTTFGYVDTSAAVLNFEPLILVVVVMGISLVALNQYRKKDFV